MQSMPWDVLSNVIYNNVLVSHSHIPLSLSCGKNISWHSAVKNINPCKNFNEKVTTLQNKFKSTQLQISQFRVTAVSQSNCLKDKSLKQQKQMYNFKMCQGKKRQQQSKKDKWRAHDKSSDRTDTSLTWDKWYACI